MTPTTRFSAAVLAAAALLVPVSIVRAADVLLPGKTAVTRSGVLARFVAKPVSPAMFPLPTPGSGADPTSSGAGGGGGQLRIFDTALVGGVNTYALPAAGWSALSNGYRYNGS